MRNEHDYYVTPEWLVRNALNYIPFVPTEILDPGAGTGAWGKVAREVWPEAFIMGVEIQEELSKPNDYNLWINEDFFKRDDFHAPFDLIMGNPPYFLAKEFIEKSLPLLRPGGFLVFTLRLAFLESKKREELWKRIPPKLVSVCIDRPSYTGDGGTDQAAAGIFLWEKTWSGTASALYVWQNGWVGGNTILTWNSMPEELKKRKRKDKPNGKEVGLIAAK